MSALLSRSAIKLLRSVIGEAVGWLEAVAAAAASGGQLGLNGVLTGRALPLPSA